MQEVQKVNPLVTLLQKIFLYLKNAGLFKKTTKAACVDQMFRQSRSSKF